MQITRISSRRPSGRLVAAVGLAIVAMAAWLVGVGGAPHAGTARAEPVDARTAPGVHRPPSQSTGRVAEQRAPADDPARLFDIGFAGGLLVEPATVTALERLQTLLGDHPTAQDLTRLERQLRDGLPPEDAETAIRLFEGYRGYRAELRGEVMHIGMPQTREAAEALLARLAAMQRRHFDAEAIEAMFGEQNRLSRAVLMAALVQMDAGLTDAEKNTQLDAIRQSLPDNQRQSIPGLPAEAASAIIGS